MMREVSASDPWFVPLFITAGPLARGPPRCNATSEPVSWVPPGITAMVWMALLGHSTVTSWRTGLADLNSPPSAVHTIAVIHPDRDVEDGD